MWGGLGQGRGRWVGLVMKTREWGFTDVGLVAVLFGLGFCSAVN